jgi:hypothetical protein
VTTIVYLINIALVPGISCLYMIWNPAMEATMKGSLRSAGPWLGTIVALIVAILPDFLIRYIRQRFWPTEVRLYAERSHKQSMQNSGLKKEYSKSGIVQSVEAMRFMRDEEIEMTGDIL